MVADITTQGSLLPIITCLLGKYLQLFGEQEAIQEYDLKHNDECFPLVMQFYDQVFEAEQDTQNSSRVKSRNLRSTLREARYSQVSAYAAQFMRTMSVFYRAGLFNT